MPQKQPPEKSASGAVVDLAPVDDTPMRKFSGMAKRLVNVSRAEYVEQEDIDRKKRSAEKP